LVSEVAPGNAGDRSVIRFLKSSTVYPEYLERLYAEHSGLALEPYKKQWQIIMSGRFGWSDFWKTHLEATGDFIAEEIIFNFAPLQKAWARDAGVKYSESDWMCQILQAQMEAFRPDVWFVHGYEITPEIRLRLRDRVPSIRWVIGWDGIVKNDAAFYAGSDQMLVCHPDSLDFYRQKGFRAYHFRLGIEKSVVENLTTPLPKHQVTFVGGVSLSQTGHNQRLTVLDRVSRELPVSFWLSGNVGLNGAIRAFIAQVRMRKFSYAMTTLSMLPAAIRLGRLSRGSVFGLDMYRILAASRIVLNVHIDSAQDKAANMRLFEATGAGACLVTDWKDNLAELFDVDRELVSFRNTDECIAKVAYLLRHEHERSAIATAGKARTLRDHTLGQSISQYARELTNVFTHYF
jgi:spore maturation protein CgeB